MQFYITFTVIILFSLTVHEYSHGRVAYFLGDNTAKRLGRLTFNPIKHLDIFGVLCFYFLGFGWAKPVPVNGRNFENPHRDMMYVAAAGPASNLILALIFGFLVRVTPPEQNIFLFVMLCYALYINVALAIFNLLPIFPLDGASVLKGLVSQDMAAKLAVFDRYSGFVLLGVFLLDYFAQTGIILGILRLPMGFMVEFFTQEAFPYVKQVIRFL
ncbi:site-2 protease family protein [Nitrospina watsonii]|uniref:Zinc metalloprotease YwhC n=1 Tax=Nitrospina watsonii TaxID=1323948 RepID=A0ABM9HEE4_9BACT|nr:site-2 protease family protein [Nitrospina watsonii]CAI2718575.1 Putative zinc metalloprotease YwhC [Nitrospina watsonii]